MAVSCFFTPEPYANTNVKFCGNFDSILVYSGATIRFLVAGVAILYTTQCLVLVWKLKLTQCG